MKTLARLFTLACLTGATLGQTNIVSDPLGFNSVTCRPESDTIVGVPFRPNGSQQGALASAPSAPIADHSTLTLAGSPNFTADEFQGTHYVKFSSGTLDGRFFPVTGNTADTLTIFLNGDSVATAVADDTVIIAAYWTLDALFDPSVATTDAATTGHAIVASPLSFQHYSELLLPDLTSPGTNLAPNQLFYIYGGAWRKVGQPTSEDWGTQQLLPDTYFVVRHSSYVSQSTTLKCSGEVELGQMAIQLGTQTNQYQDNFIALPRPVDVTLNELGLVPGAFVESTGSLPISAFRKDELILFDNDLPAYNKSAAGVYYYYNGAWRANGAAGDVSFNNVVIPAGTGFMIRKAPTATGETVFWDNSPTYDNQP